MNSRESKESKKTKISKEKVNKSSNEMDNYDNLLTNVNNNNKDILKFHAKLKSNISFDGLFYNLKDNISKYIELKDQQCSKNKINEKQISQCNNL